MQFVLWGAGFRGQKLIDALGKNRIVAFIDSDPSKIGTDYYGFPVISLEMYKREYSNSIIIITPLFQEKEIADTLDAEQIFSYLFLSESYSFFWPVISFSDLPLNTYRYNDCIGIYGLNLFSLLLYEYMDQKGYTDIVLINDKNDHLFTMAQQYGIRIQDSAGGTVFNKIIATTHEIDMILSRHSNIIVDDFGDSHIVNKYSNPVLKKFKDIGIGKRIFIVATGPSLKISDLDRLHQYQEISMSVNRAYKCFEMTNWRPDYYVVADDAALDAYGNEIASLELNAIFLKAQGDKVTPALYENPSIYMYHSISYRSCLFDSIKISSDIVRGIYTIYTVVIDCLQIAFYMGFDEIYLLGADCSYEGAPNNSGNHFIKDYYAENDRHANVPFPIEGAFRAYQVARHYAERHGIKIFNATRGGGLEVFERVDFDKLF